MGVHLYLMPPRANAVINGLGWLAAGMAGGYMRGAKHVLLSAAGATNAGLSIYWAYFPD